MGPIAPGPARGFTLIELMVGVTIGLFIVAAGFTLISHQTRLLSFADQSIDIDESGRHAIALLAKDMAQSGSGAGYRSDGTFAGLFTNTFAVPGGAAFTSNGQAIVLSSGTFTTDDIGMRLVAGNFVTIAAFAGNAGQICSGSRIENGETVLLVSDDWLLSRSAVVSGLAAGACTNGDCVNGCVGFTWADDTTYLSEAGAQAFNYVGGEMGGDFKFVVWFVIADASGTGELRRAEVTASEPCTARNASCGGVVADNVETVQMRVWQWSGTAWTDRTGAASLATTDRVRVDLEIAVRSRTLMDAPQEPARLTVDPGVCIPNCANRDNIRRHVVRTSVDVRNSGRGIVAQ